MVPAWFWLHAHQQQSGCGGTDRMDSGCALGHTVMSGFSGIHTQQVHLEKPELFSVSEVKGLLYDECDTAEECFSVCKARVQRRKHGHVKTHSAPLFPLQITPQPSIVFQNICGHFNFTVTSLPPPHVCGCTCLLWHVASSQLVLVQDSIFRSASYHKNVWRNTAPLFIFVLITQNTTVPVICISHMPSTQRSRTKWSS